MDRKGLYREVAKLHAACIDQGFLTTLGIPFLALMYQAIDETPGGVLLVETAEGRVLGFVSGGIGMGPIYRRMLGHPLRLGISLFPVMFRPRAWVRIVEILRYGRGHPAGADLPGAELLSIAVSSGSRGTGVAESLYRQLKDEFQRRGISAFRITVGAALMPAHRFYARMGAKPLMTVEVHAGESSTIYVQQT